MDNPLNVHYHKRSQTRFLVFLGDLNIGTVSYSESVGKWFVHFSGISVEVWELDSKQECDKTIREKCAEFLQGCYET